MPFFPENCLFLPLPLAGGGHSGFPHFTRAGGERRSVPSSAAVLLPPPGSHPAAGGPRLAHHLAVGNQLDTDVSDIDHPGNCSGDSQRRYL